MKYDYIIHKKSPPKWAFYFTLINGYPYS